MNEVSHYILVKSNPQGDGYLYKGCYYSYEDIRSHLRSDIMNYEVDLKEICNLKSRWEILEGDPLVYQVYQNNDLTDMLVLEFLT